MSARSPIITANWLTSGDKAWTLPIGAQVGRVVKIGGKLPVNFACRRLLQRAAAAIRPDLAAADAGHFDFLTTTSAMSAANEPAYL